MRHLSKKKIYLWVTSILISISAYSQQLTTVENSLISEIEVCQTESLEISITKNMGSYTSTDTVAVTIDLPSSIELTTASLSGSGNLTIDNSNPLAPVLKVTNVSGGSIDLSYSIKAACELFNASTSPAQTNNYAISYNNSFDHSSSSSPYNIVSSWIVFDAAGSSGLNYGLGQFNVPIERTFKYINTSSTDFNGDFIFQDTVEADMYNAGVQFIDAEIVYPVGAELYQIVTDSSVEIKASIVGLGIGDSIVIKERVYLISCPSGIDNSVTWFQANYGCAGENTCQTIADVTSFTTSAFDPNDKPVLQYRFLNTSYSCPANDDQRTFKFTNTGNGNAESIEIRLTKSLGNHISYFDTTTIQLYKYVGGTMVNVPYESFVVVMNASGPTPGHPHRYYIKSLEPIASGDSIFLSYPEQHVCIDSSDYGNYFNSITSMNNIRVLVRFNHPCFPTGFRDTDNSKSVWGRFAQQMGLSQNFENLTGSMEMNEEKWFEIANQTPLIANGTHSYFPHEMAIDISKSQFQVELTLEPGLGLVDDSLMLCSFQNTEDSIWHPNSITYITGNPAFPGQGDKIIATFDIPAYFQQSGLGNPHYKYGALWEKSSSYYMFFNNFRVKFKLHAYCEYVTGNSVATIEEKTYLVYDKTCTPDCRIPLSSVSDLINIHCPGCKLPGWNLSAFDLQRRNAGGQDNNNNNFPDSYPNAPADPNLANLKRVMLGDTIDCHLEGHTSNGEGPGVLFSDIGFDYVNGQFLLQGAILQNLAFLGATGSYTRYDGSVQTFIIPQGAGVLNTGGFTIDIGIAALESYGLPAGFITRFWSGESMTIDPQFRVINNLNNGGGADPYFSTESISAWYNMSGTPFTGIGIKPDANEVNIDTLQTFTAAEKAALMYWCTGYDGRITGIGTDFVYTPQSIENYNGIWGVSSRLDPCYSKIKTVIYTDVGEQHSTANRGYDASNQSALNAFNFEIRNLWMLDSISWVIPADWEVHRVEFRISKLKKNTTRNVTTYSCGSFDWYAPYVYPDSAIVMQDSTVTVHPALYYKEITSFPTPDNCPENLVAYDETKRYSINLVLRMKDCNTRDIVDLSGSYPITTHWSNFPGAITGDTVIVKPMGNNRFLNKPSATLDVQVLASNQNTVTGDDLSWDININTQPGSYLELTNRSASNTFFYFESPSNNINVTDMHWISNGLSINAVDSINGIPLWRLGKVGNTYSFGGRVGGIEVNAEYNCYNVQGVDSLYLIYGWNCYEYPTAINEACYYDTLVIYIEPENPGLQGLLTVNDVVNACDTLNYDLELKATGLGNVQSVQVRLNLPTGGELTYLTGSGMVSFDGSSMALEPNLDSLGLFWNLDSVNFMVNSFNGLSPAAYLNFDVKTDCGYNDEQVELEVSATNYCGKLIGPFNLERSPEVILGLPQLDSLDLMISTSTMAPCNDSSLITLDFENVGTKSTGEFNTLEFVLPSNLLYSSGDAYTSINGNTLTFNLDQGIAIGATQTIAFYVTNTSSIACGSYPITGTLFVGEEYYCDSVLCFLDGGQNNAVTTNGAINIVDTIPPVIIGVPANATVSCNNVPDLPTVNATDNCPVVVEFAENNTPGNCASNYTLTRTWTATDECGNVTTSSQILMVVDNEAPIIDCPSDITLTAGDSIAIWSLNATDNCELQQVTSDIASGSVFAVGTTTVIVTATDACGNVSTCTFEVTRIPPLIVDAGGCQTVHIGYAPTACTDLTATILTGSTAPYTYTWSNGDTGATINVCPQQTTTYTVTVTDANNFSATSTVTVYVIDVSCGNNGNKVVVCHIPPGNPGNVQEICIAPQAVGAHIDPLYGHEGCSIGTCDEVDPCGGFANRSAIDHRTATPEKTMLIYPNPNSGTFTIQLPDNINLEGVTLSIQNVLGQTIQQVRPTNLLTTIHLEEHSIEGALYFVTINATNYFETQKVMIK